MGGKRDVGFRVWIGFRTWVWARSVSSFSGDAGMPYLEAYFWLARNEVLDPYSGHYMTQYSSFDFLFPSFIPS